MNAVMENTRFLLKKKVPGPTKTAVIYLVTILLCSNIYGQMQQTPSENNLFIQTSEMANLIIRYRQDKQALLNFYGVQHSPERRNRLQQLAANYLEQVKLQDFNKMSINGKVDYVLLERDIQEDARMLAAEEKEYSQISKYIPFADEIYKLEKSRRRGLSLDAQQTARQMAEIINQVEEAQKSIKKASSIDMPLTERAKETIEGLQDALKSINEFYSAYDPMYTWWVPVTYKKLDSTLNTYAKLIGTKGKLITSQKKDESGIRGTPIGNEEFIRQLKLEMIPYTPAELIEIANKEFAWCDKEMLKASREMGFGDDWKKALEKVKNTYVPAGKQPELVLKLYNESLAFIKERDLITIPPLAEETWEMTMMSPERQLVNPFFLGGKQIIISYPTSTMEFDDKMMSMRGNNPYFSRGIVQHELIPGHNLQFFMNSRYKTYREFDTPFWTEGWALYWELILYDMKFAKTPEERIGMLFWRMHRCARIIFSTSYHLGKWTPQECIDFLVDRVGHERANAEGEVRRSFTGRYGPLYQIAYLIGGLQFYNLKKELVDSGKMTYKQYHDAVMKENSLPVEMVRSILTKQPPPQNFETNWRFYDRK